MELDRRGAELLFQVLTEREENNSMAIASNESFSKAHMFPATSARRHRSITGWRMGPRGRDPMQAGRGLVPWLGASTASEVAHPRLLRPPGGSRTSPPQLCTVDEPDPDSGRRVAAGCI